MTTTSGTWTEEILELAGTKVQMVKGGSGKPLLVLHDEMGYAGWLRFHEELSKDRTLYIPSHAGYGGSDRLEWIMGMRDLAGWYLEVLDDLALGPIDVMGFSIGGWLAAEMDDLLYLKLSFWIPSGFILGTWGTISVIMGSRGAPNGHTEGQMSIFIDFRVHFGSDSV